MAKVYELVQSNELPELSRIVIKDVMPVERVVSIEEIKNTIAIMEDDIKSILEARNALITEIDEMSKALSLTVNELPELTETTFESVPIKKSIEEIKET